MIVGQINTYMHTVESQAVDIHHYYGCTDYGDNVGDLWFITHLLRQLTLEYDDLVIK